MFTYSDIVLINDYILPGIEQPRFMCKLVKVCVKLKLLGMEKRTHKWRTTIIMMFSAKQDLPKHTYNWWKGLHTLILRWTTCGSCQVGDIPANLSVYNSVNPVPASEMWTTLLNHSNLIIISRRMDTLI